MPASAGPSRRKHEAAAGTRKNKKEEGKNFMSSPNSRPLSAANLPSSRHNVANIQSTGVLVLPFRNL